jgi:hypothetical protein
MVEQISISAELFNPMGDRWFAGAHHDITIFDFFFTFPYPSHVFPTIQGY